MTYKLMPASAIVVAIKKFQTRTVVAQDRIKMVCAEKASHLYAPSLEGSRYKIGARMRGYQYQARKTQYKSNFCDCEAKHNVNTFTKVATSAVKRPRRRMSTLGDPDV
jgi:hypothetical protein